MSKKLQKTSPLDLTKCGYGPLKKLERYHVESSKSNFKKKYERHLKKTQRPNAIQILWIVKKARFPNNSRYRFAAIEKWN